MSDSAVDVSIVLPITSTDADVGPLLEGYSQALRDSGRRFELVFVLDGVGGRIERELRERVGDYPIQIVRLQGSGLGESIALAAGVDRARGELVVYGPQYLQIEPADVTKVIQALESGADCVATWRDPRIDPLLNRLQSRFFNWCLRLLMGVRFHDLNSGLRGLRRHVLDQIHVYGEQYRFLPVLAMRQGFRTVEVRVRHREEKGRTGFYGIGVYARRSLDILTITFLARFTQRPLRFFGMLGILSIAIGLALSIDPLWERLFQGGTAQQPILVLGTVLVAFGIQFIGFGLVGEIIIFTQARNLRRYQIDEVLEGTEEIMPDAVSASPAPPAGALRVRELLPGEDARWDSFVRRNRGASFYHLSGWRRVVEEVFRHEPHYLVAERGGQWLGVLPLFWVRSPFLGRNLVSVPYGVYGGIVADADDVRRELISHAAAIGRRLGASYIELRHIDASCAGLESSDLYLTFRKDLPADPGAVMPAIPKKARAEVRRARDRFGLVFEELDELGPFYELFARNKRHLGTPSLPQRWFQALREEFGREIVLHRVLDPGGEALAAVMSFGFNGTLCSYYSGSDHSRHKTGVNDFIYCKIMEWGAAAGFRRFDFGRSRRDSGPARFKINMGFQPEPLHYQYQMLRQTAVIPEFHPSNPKLRLPQRIWSTLPPFVTERLGSHLSRYLP